MAAFEEISDRDAELRSELRKRRNVFVSRPAYTEEQFQQQHEETVKEKVSVLNHVKRRVGSCSISCGVVKKFFMSVLPIVSWLPKYDIKTMLSRDFVSGLTVGIFRIPHGMAHAILADVSPIFGLYTSFFPPLVYAVFGTSRQLNIGTFAVVSIMSGQAIDKVMEVRKQELSQSVASSVLTTIMPPLTVTSGADNSSFMLPPSSSSIPFNEALERAQAGAMLAMLVGIIQIAMSVLRLGFVTCYLADPLVRGFTTGAAFHVFTSQFNKLFGVPVVRHSGIFAVPKTYIDFFKNIGQTNISALVISVLVILFLVIVKELQDKYKDKLKFPLPTELAVIIIATGAVFAGDLSSKYGMDIVGEISASSLPAPILPPFRYASLLISDAFVIAIVGFSVSVSLSVIFAKRNNYEVSSNQELLGYGASNMLSSFFLCYPSSGSLSRTLLQDLAGGQTQIAGIISSIPILLVLFLLTQFFESLPVSCLAAIVVVALRGMFRQFKDIRELWRFSRIDCMLWLITCTAVVLLGVDIGLGVGVAVAIFTVILRTQKPKCCIVGHIPDTDIYRDLSYYDAASELPGIKIFRVNAPIYFANADYIKESMYSQTGINPLKILQQRAKQERKLAKAQVKYKKCAENENQNQNENETQNGEVAGEHELASIRVEDARQEDLTNSNHHDSVEPTIETTETSAGLIDPGASGSSQEENGSRGTEEHDGRAVRTVIMDFGAVSFVDAMGLSTLKVIVADYEKVDINIVLANCRGPIRAFMFRSGFLDMIGLDKIYITLHDAVLQTVDNKHHLLEGQTCRLITAPGGVVKYYLDDDDQRSPTGAGPVRIGSNI